MVFSCFHKHFNVKLEHENTSNMKHSQSNGPLARLRNYMLHSKRSLIIGLELITLSWLRGAQEKDHVFVLGGALCSSVCLPTGIYISSCSHRLKTALFQANFFEKVYMSSIICIFKEYVGRYRFETPMPGCVL